MKRIGLVFAVIFALYAPSVFAAQSEYYTPKPDGKYDNNTYLVDPEKYSLEKAVSSVPRIVTRTVFKAPEGLRFPDDKTTFEVVIFGRGVVLNGTLLTLSHVVVRKIPVAQMPDGSVKQAQKLSEETFIVSNGVEHKLKPLYIDGSDIALFEIPLTAKVGAFPYAIGDSDELKLGNYIYVIGDPLALGAIRIREGIVSSLPLPEIKNVFWISNGIYPGDSGSPAIAIRDGRFELVGIVKMTTRDPDDGYIERVGGALGISAIGREIFEKCDNCSEKTKKFFSQQKKTR